MATHTKLPPPCPTNLGKTAPESAFQPRLAPRPSAGTIIHVSHIYPRPSAALPPLRPVGYLSLTTTTRRGVIPFGDIESHDIMISSVLSSIFEKNQHQDLRLLGEPCNGEELSPKPGHRTPFVCGNLFIFFIFLLTQLTQHSSTAASLIWVALLAARHTPQSSTIELVLALQVQEGGLRVSDRET